MLGPCYIYYMVKHLKRILDRLILVIRQEATFDLKPVSVVVQTLQRSARMTSWVAKKWAPMASFVGSCAVSRKQQGLLRHRQRHSHIRTRIANNTHTHHKQQTHTHTLTHSHTLSHTLTHSHTLSHTLTHSHSQSHATPRIERRAPGVYNCMQCSTCMDTHALGGDEEIDARELRKLAWCFFFLPTELLHQV